MAIEMLLVLAAVFGVLQLADANSAMLAPLECPKLECTIPRSMANHQVSSTKTICCPSCLAPSSATCPSACAAQKLTSTPCDSSCGSGGCPRNICGEPKTSVSKCCNPIVCAPPMKVFLDSDCCPRCYDGTVLASLNYTSKAKCNSADPTGVGRIVVEPGTNKLKLVKVQERVQSSQAGMEKLRSVCTVSDLDLINRTMHNLEQLIKPLFQDIGNFTVSSILAGPTAIAARLTNMTAMVSRMFAEYAKFKKAVEAITSPNCRNPLLCTLAPTDAMMKYLQEMTNIVTAASRIATDTSKNVLTKTTEITQQLTRLTTIGTQIKPDATLECFKDINDKPACVDDLLNFNFQELVQKVTDCSIRTDAATITEIGTEFMGLLARKEIPGIGVMKGLTCHKLRSDASKNCRMGLYKVIGEHIERSCGLKGMFTKFKEAIDNTFRQCTGDGKNATKSDIREILGPCTFSESTLEKLNPATLLEALNETASSGLTTMQKIAADCPEMMDKISRATSKAIDPTTLKKDDLKQLIGAVPSNALKRLPSTICSELSGDDSILRSMSTSLRSDPDIDEKCQAIMDKCKASFSSANIRNFTACAKQLGGRDIATAFSSPKELDASFQKKEMRRPDVMASTKVGIQEIMKRDLGSSGKISTSNFEDYKNILWAIPEEKLNPSICDNNTIFNEILSQLGPNNPMVKKCVDRRPKPSSATQLAELSKDALSSLSCRDITSALSGSTSTVKDTIANMMSTLYPTSTTTSADASGVTALLDNEKQSKKREQIARSLVQTFMDTNAAPENISDSDISAEIFVKVTPRFLKKMSSTKMLTVATKCSAKISEVNRGTGREIAGIVCQQSSNCQNVDEMTLSSLANFIIFLNETEINNLPTARIQQLCGLLQDIGQDVIQSKCPLKVQKLLREKCIKHIDYSTTGGNNNTDKSSTSTTLDSVAVNALPACATTAADAARLTADGAETLFGLRETCPPDDTVDKAIVERYCQQKTGQTHSLKVLKRFYAHYKAATACANNVTREEIQTNGAELADSFLRLELANKKRDDEGNQADNAASTATDAVRTKCFRSALTELTTTSSTRKKRATTAITCTDIQNLQGGVASMTSTELDSVANAEFDKCFSVFGNADTVWSTDHCTKLKTKTEALYGASGTWNNTVLLTISCMTQCWDQTSINNILYTGISHISNIGTYCTKFPTTSKSHVMTRYISAVHSSTASSMTLAEISAMGHLACGPSSTHVSQMNHSHVVNSLSDLGNTGPCSETIMTSYVSKIKTNLGSTVSSWTASYFSAMNHLLGGLSDSDISSLTGDQIAQIPAAAVTKLSSTKLSQFTAAQLGLFSASQRSAVTEAQLGSLTPAQKKSLGHATSGAEQIFASKSALLGCLMVAYLLVKRM